MPDFVVSGISGFIGSHVAEALRKAGYTVTPYGEFRDRGERAGTFVHCANIHSNPADNATLTADVLATIAPRVDRFVQIQTFATLHGGGALDTARMNVGKKPFLMGPYGFGKLLQEQITCREAARYSDLAVHLFYLPVVLGGGSWGRVLEQARLHGVVLPPMISAKARANYIHVGDIAERLVETRADTTPGIRRVVLNRADSATLTWPEFFRDAASVAIDNSPKAIVKRAVICGGLAGYNIVSRLKTPTIPAGVPDRRPPRPVVAKTPEPILAEPFRFSGLIQEVVCQQPYIAAR
jgi:nucleoside-diphosphate-sugar epimerase